MFSAIAARMSALNARASMVSPSWRSIALLGRKGGEGATRTQLGKMAKCDAPRVTEAIKALAKDRLIHLTEKGMYYLTASGEADLMKWLAENRAI